MSMLTREQLLELTIPTRRDDRVYEALCSMAGALLDVADLVRLGDQQFSSPEEVVQAVRDLLASGKAIAADYEREHAQLQAINKTVPGEGDLVERVRALDQRCNANLDLYMQYVERSQGQEFRIAALKAELAALRDAARGYAQHSVSDVGESARATLLVQAIADADEVLK